MEIDSLKTVLASINLTENLKMTCFQVNTPAGAPARRTEVPDYKGSFHSVEIAEMRSLSA